MKINPNVVFKDYSKLKLLVEKCILNNKLEDACVFMQSASTLMYNTNLIYTDSELEEALRTISNTLFSKTIKKGVRNKKKKRIVFYDYFMLDNRGLTEQYLNALFSSEYEMLFIGIPKEEKSKEIINKLSENNSQVIYLNQNKEIEKAQIIYNSICNFEPDIILTHTSPWDIAGLVSLTAFDGHCPRYLINITDHAFWLGTTVFDYFIEFRDYGYNISRQYRKIPENKILKLPYYPIINKTIPFAGFSFETKGKTLILSGGSIYKIQGSPVFLELVKYILVTYENTIFLFLGNGDFSYLQKFIEENNFQNRFFYESERKDIWQVFCHCDLYLNTYPISGSLLTQYACMAGKIPITLNDTGYASDNNINELLLTIPNEKIQACSFEDCKLLLDKYLKNKEILKIEGKKLKEYIITPELFSSIFLDYICKPINKIPLNTYKIDSEMFAKQCLDRLNDNHCIDYYKCFIRKKIKFMFYFWIYYFKFILLKK